MPPAKTTYDLPSEAPPSVLREDGIESGFIGTLQGLKNDPGNGYTKTLLCFLQLFIVSNRDQTFYFANNNARHFACRELALAV
jgi:hypothetical protein